MYTFSARSTKQLTTCHPDLQKLFLEVIKHYDCSILQGYRDRREQNKFQEEGRSKVRWPHSKHNILPSRAVDAVPYPIGWNTEWEEAYEKEMIFFAGLVIGFARNMGIRIRWGGDWDVDMSLRNNIFNDYAHFELI